MILHSLTYKGLSVAFRDREVTVDFDALGPGLVAIVGDNGAGKSHLLELSGPATLYREFPSYRESFVEHVAPGVRDAYAALTFSIGATRYVVRTQADPLANGGRGKTEAYVTKNGTPTAGPGVKDVALALAQVLPSRELFLAGPFACQASVFAGKGGTGSFFALDKADRKDLIVAMLMLGHLQTLAEASRARAKDLLIDLARVRDQVPALAARTERAREVRMLLAAVTTRRADAEATLAAERAREATDATRIEDARQVLTAAQAEAARVTAERTRLAERAETATVRATESDHRLAALDRLLADRDAIVAADRRVTALRTALALVDREATTAAEQLAPAVANAQALEAKRNDLLAMATRIRDAHDAAVAAQARVDARRGIAHEATPQRETIAAATAAIATHDARTADLERAAGEERAIVLRRAELAARREDLAPRRTLLDHIPNVPACGECPLTADARDAGTRLAAVERELAHLPAVDGQPAQDALRAHQRARGAYERNRDGAQAWLDARAQDLAILLADAPVGARVADVAAELERVIAEGRQTRAELDRATALRQRQQATLDEVTAERTRLTAEQLALAPTAAQLAAVEAAASERAQVALARTEALRIASEAAAALAALPTIDTAAAETALAEAIAALDRARTARTAAEAAFQGIEQEHARLDGERAALGDPETELAALRERERSLEHDAAAWALLEQGLGRDGVQALELDAAGPAITAIANDLLYACYGSRFQLALETTATKKDGGQKEVFDLRILDSEAGRGEAKRGSGGEMVLLDEALRLALVLHNTERSGFPMRTLWRDEPAGALSPANADRYLAMLRRAMQRGGFHQCLFIAHQPEVWQQADARLYVGNGLVQTDGEREAA